MDKCPFCGAGLKEAGSGMTPSTFNCDTQRDEFGVWHRNYKCYENQLAALRPLVEALAVFKTNDNDYFCPFCVEWSSEFADKETHKPNCPVLKAREMVKG